MGIFAAFISKTYRDCREIQQSLITTIDARLERLKTLSFYRWNRLFVAGIRRWCYSAPVPYILNLMIILLFSAYFVYADDNSFYANIDTITKIALVNNLDIQIAKFDAYIQRNNLGEAQSIFDTFINASISYDKNKEDAASTLTGTASAMNNYSVGINKKIPSGTTLDVEAYNQRNWSNSSFYTTNPNTEANVKVSLTQALAKNFFGIIDRGNIKITKFDIKNSDFTSLDEIESSLSRVQRAYWELVLRCQELKIKEDMLSEARKLYSIYQKKIKTGLVEEPDLLAAKANVSLRENDVLKSKMKLEEAKNNLLYLINSDADKSIIPLDKLDTRVKKFNLYSELKKAIRTRRDYRIAKNALSSENINLVLKKNSLWPQVDLNASFAKNGIDSSYKNSWSELSNQNHSEWYVGVNIDFSFERKKEKAQYSKAKLSKAKAIVIVKRTERLIFKDINNSVTELNTVSIQVETNRKIVRLQEEKLKAEEKRLRYGRSSSDVIIRFQNDVLNARLGLVNSLFSYRLALINMKRNKNTLLTEYWKGVI